MQTNSLENIAVKFSQDSMTAFLRLPEPLEGQSYQADEIMGVLKSQGVVYGIEEGAIHNLLIQGNYDKDVEVAFGKPAQDGTQGYYEYFFDENFEGKPTINADGTVNYQIKLFEMVTEGQKIAEYHPAKHGIDGCTVRDTPVRAIPGRDMPKLRGRGFAVQEDGVTYVASISGKIERVQEKITILPVFEVNGDVDVNMGNIDFRGDVIIHGSINDDVEVRATGTVTVDKVIQGGSVYANKDVVLAGGVLGNSKSVIDAKGNVSAKFFEYATIRSKGNVTADVFLNSNIYCEGKAMILSNKGCVIGGTVHAVSGIEANSIGNNAQVNTRVLVGNGGEIRKKMEELRNSIKKAVANIEKTEMILQKFTEFEEQTGQSVKDDPRRVQLVRIRVRDLAKKAADEDALRKLQTMVDNAKDATVRVHKFVYPGVWVSIDTCDAKCKDEFKDVEFFKKQGKVVLRRLSNLEGTVPDW